MSYTVLRLPKVKDRTGLSRSSIYLKISQDQFPKSISLGARAVGWIESEIDQWLSDQISSSRQTEQEG
jgi:prophage regulatory protein